MPATITGIVFNDLNHNGIYDTGEPGIADVYVYLSNSSGMVEAQTDASGNYSFSITAAGSYTIYETVVSNAVNPPTTFTQPNGFTVSNGPRKISITVTAANISGNAVLSGNNFAHDINTNTLTCTANFIQFVGNPTEWVTINLVTGTATDRGGLNPPHYINAIGYNPLDDYIYGYDDTVNGIARVDASGNIMVLGEPTGMPVTANQYNTGCFDDQGYLYLYYGGSARFYVVDLRPNSPTYMKLVDPTNGFAEQTSAYGVALVNGTPNVADWVWLPATAQTGIGVNGFLYGIQTGGVMARVNLDNAHVINMTTSGPTYNNSYGAMSGDAQGNIYAIANQNGNVYRYTVNNITATGVYFSNTYYDSHNDGAMCRNAILLIDFGDAPDTGIGNGPGNYNTLLASNGPRHQVVSGLMLGTQITAEEDAYQNSDATGDDLTQGIQDDGVVTPLPSLSLSSTDYIVNVMVTNTTNQPANLYGWVDFNQNGLFEVNESQVVIVPANSGIATYPLTFMIPTGTILAAGTTFARFRLTTDTLIQNADAIGQDTASVGPAGDGEVEDYILTIEAVADLQVTKTASADTVIGNDSLTYTITITNNGPDPAMLPLLVDPIPTQLKNPSYSIDNGMTWQNVALGSLTLPTLQAGDTFTVLAKGTVIVYAQGPIINTASVTSTTFDPDMSNNSATVTTATNSAADLSIVKLGSSDTIATGDTLIYTLLLSNAGPEIAKNVIVTDVLPTDLLNPEYSFNNGPWTPWTGQLNIGDLAENTNATLQIRSTVNAGASSPITNTATISSDTLDPNLDNNTSTAQTDVTDLADLAITKQGDQDPIPLGGTLTYTIQVTNNGPSTANNVQITDVIPAPLQNPEFSIDNGASWQPWSGSYNLATLADGAIYTVLVRGDVDPATTASMLTNTANVSSDTTDPDLSNNTATALTSVVQPSILIADLSVSKSATPTIATIGELLQYELIIMNNGPDTASNTSLAENLPAYLLNPEMSFDGSNWTTFTNPTSLGDLASNARITIYIRGIVDPALNPNALHAISNTATVTSDTPDDDLTNNAVTHLTPVTAEADIAIVKTLLTDPFTPGTTVQYKLLVTNNGPSNSRNVVLSDAIPSGIINSQYSLDNGITWLAWTGTLQLGTLDVNAQQTILIQGLLVPAATGDIINTAMVNSITPDPNPDNNLSSTVNTPTPEAVLRITKTASANPAIVGNDLIYAIYTQNTGPSYAYNVVITDAPPPELTNLQYSINGIDWYPWTGTYTYNAIPVGGARTLQIKGTVTTYNPAGLTNTATAIGDNTPAATATVNTPTHASADVGIIKWASTNHVTAGNTLGFTLTITNYGPSPARNVIVTDTIPDTLENVQYSLDQTNWESWTGSYTIGHMNQDQTIIIYLQGVVSTDATNKIINTALVTSTTSDPNLSNNSNSFEVYVEEFADLSITKLPNTTPEPGEDIIYTLTITNAGPSNAQEVVIQDDIPTNLENVQYSLDDGNTWVTWTSPYPMGTLDAGVTQTILLKGTVTSDATNFLSNTAVITSATPDPDPTNNTSTSTLPLPSGGPSNADLSITKTAEMDIITPGQTATYNLEITNNGPDLAENVVVTDIIQSALRNPRYSTDDGTTWNDWSGSLSLGNLEPGESSDLLINGVIKNSAATNNTAMVISNTADPNTANNIATINTPLAQMADLSIVKISCDPCAYPCESLHYTVIISNNGPDIAENVNLTDIMPKELHRGRYSLDNGQTWRIWSNTLNLGNMKNDQKKIILFRGIVNNCARGIIVNTAKVISDTMDPNLQNNTFKQMVKVYQRCPFDNHTFHTRTFEE